MKLISLQLPDTLLQESERNAESLQVSRAEYIRRAIDRMNRDRRAANRAKRIAAASHKVRRESMRVNAEFAKFESTPDA